MIRLLHTRSVVLAMLLSAMSLLQVQAQDIHFSQFYASPLNLNPALTGKINGSWRIAGIYRNQWNSVASPYITPSISFDMPFKLGDSDAIGAGILFVNDKSGDGALSLNIIQGSLAYHKGLGANGRHQLSLGIQGGYVQYKADVSNLTFENQYDGAQIIEQSNGEVLADDVVAYPDFNIGLFYNVRLSKKTVFYAGGNLLHLTRPKEEFTAFVNDSRRPMRKLVHSGFEVGLSDRVSLYPGVLYMEQISAHETNLGTNLGFHLGKNPTAKETTVYIGGWYRLKDAIIPMVGLEYNRIRVGVSYDINTSDLKTVSNGNGGFEISLIYIGKIAEFNENFLLFCPRY